VNKHAKLEQELICSALISNKEFKLLLVCSRTKLCDQDERLLQQLLASDIDWQQFIELTLRHRTLPLAYFTLKRYGWEYVPGQFQSQLQNAYRRNHFKALMLTAVLVQIKSCFESAGITMVAFKGPTLAMLLYDKVGMRHAGDLDILIAQDDVPKARQLLQSLGYALTKIATDDRVEKMEPTRLYLNQDYEFKHQTKPVRVELHWRFGKSRLHTPLPVDLALQNYQMVTISDKPLPSLASIEDLLAYLCFHGTNHQWFRLFWLCDIAELVRRYGEQIDWVSLFARAHRQGNHRALSLGLLLAEKLLDAPLPESALRGMQRDFPAFVMRYIEWSIACTVSVDETEILYREMVKPRYALYFATTVRYRVSYLMQYLFYPPNSLVNSISLRWTPWLFPLYLPIKIGYVIYHGALRPLFRTMRNIT